MIIRNFNSISGSPLRKKALEIISHGVESIETERVIHDSVSVDGHFLRIKDTLVNLSRYKRVFVIGFGKASSLMGRAIEGLLGNRIKGGIIISTKKVALKRIDVVLGTHPMPTKKNIAATKRIVKLISGLSKDDLVIALVSGGGSALLCWPNIAFEKYMKIIRRAFTSGMDITQFNNLRKEYSNVKDGKLAEKTEARIVSLIFSDVVGDDLSTIASGPTVGPRNVKNILLLNNMVALEAMKEKAIKLGLKPVILTNKLEGEARETGIRLLNSLRDYRNRNCFLFAGETTVTIKRKGKGGRIQEMCLGAIREITYHKDAVMAAVGTDGRDGPTDAAGAIIDSTSMFRAIEKGLDHKEYLEMNLSYSFFKKMGDLINTGLTGINVADIGVVVKK